MHRNVFAFVERFDWQPYLGPRPMEPTLYVINGNTGNVLKITPPSTLATSTQAFSSYNGGLGASADGWLWTLTSSGVSALQGMTSSASPVSPTAVTTCSSSEDIERGAPVHRRAGRHVVVLAELLRQQQLHGRHALRCRLLRGKNAIFRISAMPQASSLRLDFRRLRWRWEIARASAFAEPRPKVPVTLTVTIGRSRKHNRRSVVRSIFRAARSRLSSITSATIRGQRRSGRDASRKRDDGRDGERDGDDDPAAGRRVLCERRHLHVHDFP